jgi:transposase
VEKITRIFIDTSKQFFQLHGVDAAEQVVVRRKLRRSQVLPFFAKLEPTVIGLEACGGSHHLARELAALGHEVKLVPAQYVKAYLKRGKNDGRDAEAGCEAMSRPTMRFVLVKSAESQAALMLVGVRDRLTRSRTQLSNAIRGHAAEFGLVAPRGLCHLEPLLARIAADARLPELARELFAALGREWDRLGEELKTAEARLMAWHRQNETSRRLAKIPSLGPIGAFDAGDENPRPWRVQIGARLQRLDGPDAEGSFHRRQATTGCHHPRRRRGLALHPRGWRHLGHPASGQGPRSEIALAPAAAEEGQAQARRRGARQPGRPHRLANDDHRRGLRPHASLAGPARQSRDLTDHPGPIWAMPELARRG